MDGRATNMAKGMAGCTDSAAYRRRRPEHTVLHQVVRENLVRIFTVGPTQTFVFAAKSN